MAPTLTGPECRICANPRREAEDDRQSILTPAKRGVNRSGIFSQFQPVPRALSPGRAIAPLRGGLQAPVKKRAFHQAQRTTAAPSRAEQPSEPRHQPKPPTRAQKNSACVWGQTAVEAAKGGAVYSAAPGITGGRRGCTPRSSRVDRRRRPYCSAVFAIFPIPRLNNWSRDRPGMGRRKRSGQYDLRPNLPDDRIFAKKSLAFRRLPR